MVVSRLIADGLKSAVKKSPAKIVTNADKLEAGDTAILIIGETPYAEFEGDLDTTDFTKSADWSNRSDRKPK